MNIISPRIPFGANVGVDSVDTSPSLIILRNKIDQGEPCAGVLEIWAESFGWCDQSITKITSPIHSGGLTVKPSLALSDVQFVSTMTLKALEKTYSRGVSSSTSESHSSSPRSLRVIFARCNSIFSLELPDNITRLKTVHSHLVTAYKTWHFPQCSRWG